MIPARSPRGDDGPAASWSADGRERAVSPVVGGVLLVAIVVLLAATTFLIAGGLADDTASAPQASLALRSAGDGPGARLVLRGGEEIGDGGGRIVVEGVADPDVLANRTLTLDDPVKVYPVAEAVTVYWHAPSGDESYELARFDADPVAAGLAPDVGCSWVRTHTDNGTSDVTVDVVVGCDLVTTGDVDMVSGGAVLGDVGTAQLDATNANVTGDVDSGGDVDLTNTSVGGSVDADGDVTIDTSTTVGGDVVGAQVDADASTLRGAVASPGSVSLSGTTVTDDVYLDGSFSCSASTVHGENCGSYTPAGYGAYRLVRAPEPAHHRTVTYITPPCDVAGNEPTDHVAHR